MYTSTAFYVLIFIALASAGHYEGGFEDFEGGHEGGHEVVADFGDHGGHEEHHDHKDYYAHPKYHYNYAVHDPHTGDEKQHQEERDGDSVKGSYTLKEADGTTRVVEYTADKHSGFNAVVHKIGKPNHEEHGHEHGHDFGGY